MNIHQRILQAVTEWNACHDVPPSKLYLGEEELFQLDSRQDYIVIRYAGMQVVEVARRRHFGIGI